MLRLHLQFGNTALIYATDARHVEIMKLLINAKANVNIKDEVNILFNYYIHNAVFINSLYVFFSE